jgi:hypothetical protein
MLRKLFVYAMKISRNKPWLKKSILWQVILRPIYTRIRALSGNMSFAEGARIYFKQNAERVKQITEFFYDEEYKKTFNKMINFRQTGKKNDHIHHCYHLHSVTMKCLLIVGHSLVIQFRNFYQ